MQRAISVFLVFLLIIFVVPSAAGIYPAPLNKRLEYTSFLLEDWKSFDEINAFPDDAFAGDGFSNFVDFFRVAGAFFKSFYNVFAVPIEDTIIIIRIVSVWLSGYVPANV